MFKAILLLTKKEKKMQIFLLSIILILVAIVVHQGKEIRELERKTLEAFRVVCQKIKEDK